MKLLSVLSYHIIVKSKSFFLVITVFAFLQAKGQNCADKQFYLIDSLEIDNLNDGDHLLIDTSLKLYHKAQHDTVRFSILEHIIDECWNEDVWPKYNEYLFNKVQKKLKALSPFEDEITYSYFLAGTINNKGLLAEQKGNIIEAIYQYKAALKTYEKLGDLHGMAVTLNNIGIIYNIQNDSERALDFHTQSLEIKLEIGDTAGAALSYINLGTIYETKNSFFSAIEVFHKALKFGRLINNMRVQGIAYNKIGGVYLSRGFYNNSINYDQKALSIWLELKDDVGYAISMRNIGNAYLNQKKFEEAEKYSLESYHIFKSLGYPNDIKNVAFVLYEIKKAVNDFQAALSYHEEYLLMKDSLFNRNTEKSVITQTMKYEFEKIALEDSLYNAKIQAEKDLQILEKESRIQQEKTMRYALIVGLMLMLILVFVSVKAYQRKKKDNDFINRQKAEVELQKLKIEKQHLILEETHKEISDSITYAKRIQNAILPNQNIIRSHLPDSFILFKPKDVVSGDFYWMYFNKEKEILFLAVADCTGHGVPGALVSVICNNALNRAVREYRLITPADILDKTNALVIEEFEKSGQEVKDGMDISLVALSSKTEPVNSLVRNESEVYSRSLKWAGANNSIWFVKSGSNELEELKADKQPIGRYSNSKPFTNDELILHQGDQFYLFSDGFADQFGGEDFDIQKAGGKKFKSKNLKSLLLKNASLPMNSQLDLISNTFEAWKGKLEQVDDVCIIGVCL